MILADTNILTSFTNTLHVHSGAARLALKKLRSADERIVLAPQNLYEFWAVATRATNHSSPASNGLGMTTDQARAWINYFKRQYEVLSDRDDLHVQWLEVVTEKRVKGFRSYDARLVAVMKIYGVQRILTFNGKDFAGMDVTVVDPRSV
jgi:predicted nucleic acid-binding protein